MNQRRLLNTFLEIVQIDSPTGHEKKMADWVVTRLEDWGLNPIRDDFGNLVVKVSGENEPLLLTAHLDTVEPGQGVKPVVERGVIRSLGETILGGDNKVAVAAILEVINFILEEEVEHRNLEIVFTLSEEVGNYGAVNLDYSLISAKEGFSFDHNTDLGKIVIASPFYNRFDLEIVGRSAHASVPEEGINALLVFNQALRGFKLGRVDKNTLCNIGVMTGGQVRNTVLGELTARGEVRSFVEADLERVSDRIKDSFLKECQETGAELKWDLVRENPGFKLAKNDLVVQKAVEIFQKMGVNPELERAWGCYDANIFINRGIKVVNLSSGVSGAHTVGEQIEVKDLSRLSVLIKELIRV